MGNSGCTSGKTWKNGYLVDGVHLHLETRLIKNTPGYKYGANGYLRDPKLYINLY